MDNQTTVLIIDDFEPFLSCLKTTLESDGHRVVTAEYGWQGLKELEREAPDIVLLDLNLPDMNGLEMIAAIHRNNASVPVILMSGQGSLTDAIEATRCGAWDYLTKPIHKNELGFSIDRCLERARLLRENRQYREHLEQLVQAQTAEIQESRERYRRLLESVTSYLYSVVVKNGIPVKTIHQQGCERVTGHTQEEFYSDPALWYRIIHEDDRTLVFGLSQHILTDPDNQTLEHRILHKDGSIRWVTNTMVPGWNSRALPLPGNNTAGSRLLYYDGIITDITRRKMAEEHLNIRLGSLAGDKYKISGSDTHEHPDR